MENLHRDLSIIKCRKMSQEIKFQGDALFYQENFDGALAKYSEALERDPNNEYALANIGLIYMMRLDHEQAIEYESRAINIIDSFQSETKSFQKQNQLETKLLLRRSKSYNALQDYEKSKADLDRILIIDP